MNSIANMFQAFRITNSKNPIGVIKTNPVPYFKEPTDTVATINLTLREIPLSEVAAHDDFCDCWIVIYDRVYNVTKFLGSHPGGEDVIMDYAGRDATLAFRGTGHSKDAISMLNDYLIGELPENERIFRTAHGKVLLTDVPE